MEDRWRMLFQADKGGVNSDVLGEAGKGGVGSRIAGIHVNIGEAFADDEDGGGLYAAAGLVIGVALGAGRTMLRLAKRKILLRTLHVMAGHPLPNLRWAIE